MTPFDPILNFFRQNSPPSVSLPNLKFLASTVHEILVGSQNSKSGLRDPRITPFDPILHFFSSELTALRLRAKFEVSSFNRSRDIRGSQNSKSGSRDPHMTPFDPILHFFRQNSSPSVSLPNLKFLASTVPEILGGVPKFKKWVKWPPHDPFWPNFAFFFVRTHRLPSPYQIWSF